MAFSLFSRSLAAAGLLLSAQALSTVGASSVTPIGTEYRLLMPLHGDQVFPQMSFNQHGGYLVCHDNSIDGNGLGIRARRIFPDMSAGRWTIQVNSQNAGHQQHAKAGMQSDGGAVFVWESTSGSGRRIQVRFVKSDGTFRGPEIPVSTTAVGTQSEAAVAVLSDDSVIVAWSEWERDTHMQGVFGQKFSKTGDRVGDVFQVNQVRTFNQRHPAVAALENGNFVVAWITEEQRHSESVDLYARLFTAGGLPIQSEFRLNQGERIVSSPVLERIPGGFRAAWSSRTLRFNQEHWDIETRAFATTGAALGNAAVVNNLRRGDQFGPRLGVVSDKQMIVWTSFGQDGSDEGVYARLILNNGEFDGNEFRINSTTRSKQMHPTVAGTAGGEFVAAWTCFKGGIESFDLFAQRYAVHSSEVLPQPAAPFVAAYSQDSITVTWPEIMGLEVDTYLLFIDGATTPVEVRGFMTTISRATWGPQSTHTVSLAYRLKDGRVSPESDAGSATTWGADVNKDGLPDEWQTYNWGRNWPAPNEDSDNDGSTNLEEFYAGTDPLNSNSVLRVGISAREQGAYLEWNSTPGNVYQVQVTTDFLNWENFGAPRFAASILDSIPAPAPNQYYRVIRLR